MANFTTPGNQTTIQEYSCPIDANRKILILTSTVPLSITAFFGNVLILVALQKLKMTSIHPPSKLLLGCLASTDLCVGFITQPLRIGYVMSPENSKRCYYINILYITLGFIFGSVSVLTLTAISVDRLLALMLGLRYKQIVTLKRVWVFAVTLWLFSTALAVVIFYSFRIAISVVCITLLFCIVTATFCYTKIFLTLRHHQTQVQDRVHQGQRRGEGVTLNIARYRKTVSTALWIQMTLLACYFPFGLVTGVIVNIGSRTPSLNLLWSFTISVILLNSSLNPLLYCWKMREVRQAVKNTVKQFCCLPS